MISTFLLLFIVGIAYGKVTDENCEVCVKFVRKLADSLAEDEKTDMDKIATKLKSICETAKGKDERLCYYIGAAKTSATYSVNGLAQPLSWGMPAEKVCEKMKATDSQICDLKYEKTVDLATVNLKKLRVKELRKVLEVWGEECRGCTEKYEFIQMIEEKMAQHDPTAAAKRAQAQQEL